MSLVVGASVVSSDAAYTFMYIPLIYDDHMVNLNFCCMNNIGSFATRLNPAGWDAPLYSAITFDPIKGC